MNRHVMQVPQTSLQGSCKLGDGALLLHGFDRGHHPELDHQKPRANRLGYQGHLQIRRPLKLRSWVDASAAHPQTGAQKILAANDRSVTLALTAGKPVDRIRLDDISTEVRFPHSVEKGWRP